MKGNVLAPINGLFLLTLNSSYKVQLSLHSCTHGDKCINNWHDKSATLETICYTLQWWILGNWFGVLKMQFKYSHYEGMGVPIMWGILKRSWQPSNDNLFPYFYDRSTKDEYKSALAVESTGCCVTKIEYAQSNAIEEGVLTVLIYFVQWVHTCHEFV